MAPLSEVNRDQPEGNEHQPDSRRSKLVKRMRGAVHAVAVVATFVAGGIAVASEAQAKGHGLAGERDKTLWKMADRYTGAKTEKTAPGEQVAAVAPDAQHQNFAVPTGKAGFSMKAVGHEPAAKAPAVAPAAPTKVGDQVSAANWWETPSPAGKKGIAGPAHKTHKGKHAPASTAQQPAEVPPPAPIAPEYAGDVNPDWSNQALDPDARAHALFGNSYSAGLGDKFGEGVDFAHLAGTEQKTVADTRGQVAKVAAPAPQRDGVRNPRVTKAKAPEAQYSVLIAGMADFPDQANDGLAAKNVNAAFRAIMRDLDQLAARYPGKPIPASDVAVWRHAAKAQLARVHVSGEAINILDQHTALHAVGKLDSYEFALQTLDTAYKLYETEIAAARNRAPTMLAGDRQFGGGATGDAAIMNRAGPLNGNSAGPRRGGRMLGAGSGGDGHPDLSTASVRLPTTMLRFGDTFANVPYYHKGSEPIVYAVARVDDDGVVRFFKTHADATANHVSTWALQTNVGFDANGSDISKPTAFVHADYKPSSNPVKTASLGREHRRVLSDAPDGPTSRPTKIATGGESSAEKLPTGWVQRSFNENIFKDKPVQSVIYLDGIAAQQKYARITVHSNGTFTFRRLNADGTTDSKDVVQKTGEFTLVARGDGALVLLKKGNAHAGLLAMVDTVSPPPLPQWQQSFTGGDGGKRVTMPAAKPAPEVAPQSVAEVALPPQPYFDWLGRTPEEAAAARILPPMNPVSEPAATFSQPVAPTSVTVAPASQQAAPAPVSQSTNAPMDLSPRNPDAVLHRPAPAPAPHGSDFGFAVDSTGSHAAVAASVETARATEQSHGVLDKILTDIEASARQAAESIQWGATTDVGRRHGVVTMSPADLATYHEAIRGKILPLKLLPEELEYVQKSFTDPNACVSEAYRNAVLEEFFRTRFAGGKLGLKKAIDAMRVRPGRVLHIEGNGDIVGIDNRHFPELMITGIKDRGIKAKRTKLSGRGGLSTGEHNYMGATFGAGPDDFIVKYKHHEKGGKLHVYAKIGEKADAHEPLYVALARLDPRTGQVAELNFDVHNADDSLRFPGDVIRNPNKPGFNGIDLKVCNIPVQPIAPVVAPAPTPTVENACAYEYPPIDQPDIFVDRMRAIPGLDKLPPERIEALRSFAAGRADAFVKDVFYGLRTLAVAHSGQLSPAFKLANGADNLLNFVKDNLQELRTKGRVDQRLLAEIDAGRLTLEDASQVEIVFSPDAAESQKVLHSFMRIWSGDYKGDRYNPQFITDFLSGTLDAAEVRRINSIQIIEERDGTPYTAWQDRTAAAEPANELERMNQAQREREAPVKKFVYEENPAPRRGSILAADTESLLSAQSGAWKIQREGDADLAISITDPTNWKILGSGATAGSTKLSEWMQQTADRHRTALPQMLAQDGLLADLTPEQLVQATALVSGIYDINRQAFDSSPQVKRNGDIGWLSPLTGSLLANPANKLIGGENAPDTKINSYLVPRWNHPAVGAEPAYTFLGYQVGNGLRPAFFPEATLSDKPYASRVYQNVDGKEVELGRGKTTGNFLETHLKRVCGSDANLHAAVKEIEGKTLDQALMIFKPKWEWLRDISEEDFAKAKAAGVFPDLPDGTVVTRDYIRQHAEAGLAWLRTIDVRFGGANLNVLQLTQIDSPLWAAAEKYAAWKFGDKRAKDSNKNPGPGTGPTSTPPGAEMGGAGGGAGAPGGGAGF